MVLALHEVSHLQTVIMWLTESMQCRQESDPKVCYGAQKIVTADYIIPEGISLSSECKDLIRRIFVVNPGMRINLDQIKTHPWFIRNLPIELQVRCVAMFPAASGLQGLCCLLRSSHSWPRTPKLCS